MSIHMLTRQPARDLPETTLADSITFAHGRVHEICGPSRRTLAVLIAAQLTGPILWIRPSWGSDKVAADGMAPHLNPARIVFVDVEREEDALWCAEEALRSGAAPILIVELGTPPALTPIRRLTLASEPLKNPALPLLLTPEEGGAQGIESRWHIAPAHAPGTTRWTLTRLRARLSPPASWPLSLTDAKLSAA